MKPFAVFDEVQLSQVEPEGWLRAYLEKQARGLTGHMAAAGYPFDTKGWGSLEHITGGAEGWWPYEQTGYWTDGAVRCAHLLRDPQLLAQAAQPIEFALEHADTDGFIGVRYMKKPVSNNRWPHAVFFRALMAHHSATGRRGIAEALLRHYLSGTSEHCHQREVCNVEAILWTYEQTGDARLLKHAVAAYRKYNRLHATSDTSVATMLSAKRGTEHGVTYNEVGKLGAVVYLYTGKREYLAATVNAYRKLDRDQMLIDGLHSCTEGLKGKDPLDSHETCDIADYTWSVGYLLMATGDAQYADKIERACFNAAPGAVTSDFGGLQYFSCPNQVMCTSTSNHNEFFYGHQWMSYRPNPGTECCPGEVNRIMPNFAARQWMRDRQGGVAAVFYAPSRITLPLGTPAQSVTIVQATAYPFGDEIDCQVRAGAPVHFPLSLRIPGWCRGAKVRLNGKALPLPCKPGSFVTLERTFAPNDRVTLRLPMTLKLSHWPHGGIGIERGPLVFALRVAERWEVDKDEKRQTPDFPAWNLYPDSPWNYALCVDEKSLATAVEVRFNALAGDPWRPECAPIELRIPARRVRGWNLVRKRQITTHYFGRTAKRQGDFQFTPQLPEPEALPARLAAKLETVTLVPYGCTHLRISIFPQAPPPG